MTEELFLLPISQKAAIVRLRVSLLMVLTYNLDRMEGNITVAVLVFVLILCLGQPITLTDGRSTRTNISVCPSNADSCSGLYDINQALERVTTDTILLLEPGEHILSSFVLLHNLTGVTITGQQYNQSEVTVQCTKDTGLAFFGVENLSLNNFTLDRCGVSNENLIEVLTFVHDTFEKLFNVQSHLEIALFLGDCQDVLIFNLRTRNTTGIGLLAINIHGELTNSVFENNHPKNTKLVSLLELVATNDNTEFVGGGAYIFYEDYNKGMSSFNNSLSTHQDLTISNCVFLNNTDLSSIGVVELYFQYSPFVQDIGYPLGGSGGLTVVLTQLHFSVNVEIVSSQFEGNVAMFGGGAHVSLFSGVTDSSVILSECQFSRNGVFEEPYTVGGLTIFVDVTRPEQVQNFIFPPIDGRNISILVSNTTFMNNAAYTTGAVSVNSLYAHKIADSTISVKFQQCVFERNIGLRASALSVSEQKYTGLNEGVQIVIEDCIFVNNTIGSVSASPGGSYGSTVGVQNTNITLLGRNEFLSNLGTALAGVRSPFYIHGHVVFNNNVGVEGAAIQLTSLSFLILQQHSSISIVGNSAIDRGGGIFVNLVGEEYFVVDDDCFIHLGIIDYSPRSESALLENFNVTMTFQGNRARAGSMIYGASLETCPWTSSIPVIDTNYTVFQNLYHNPGIRFIIFDEEPIGADRISALSERIEVDTSEYRPVMPGETFRVPIVALDKFQQSVPDNIGLAVFLPNQTIGIGSRVGEHGFWFLDGTTMGSNAPVTLLGTENQTLDVAITSITPGSTATTSIVFSLTQCLLGFLYNETSRSCYCDPRLSKFGIGCDVSMRSLTVPGLVWFGPLETENDSMQINDLLVSGSCPLNFCKLGPKVVTDGNFEFQCAEGSGRTGVSCGGCMDGLSVTLGQRQCKKCSNYYLFLIILILFLGVLAVIALAALQISIAEGYLNTILFYSNFVSFNSLLLLPFEPVANYLFSIAGALSLFPSFGICFFDGLSAFGLVFVYYSVVLYILLVVGVVILIAKFVNLPGQKSYSPVKVLATLLLLSYIALTELSLLSLGFVTLHTLNGETHWRWFLDPTEPFFQGRHIALGIIAITVILCDVIPLPLLTLSPNFVYNSKYLVQLKPLFDAIWAPFKTKYRWWFSFRLIARILVILLSTFLKVPHNIFALGIFLTLLLLLQQAISPFREYWCNLLDNYLVLNLILLVIGALYFQSTGNKSQHIIYTSVIVSLAYTMFLVMFVRHIYVRFPDKFDRMKEWFLMQLLRSKKGKEEEEQNPSGEKKEDPENEVSMNAGPQINVWQQDKTLPGYVSPTGPHVVSFTEFREPLLDDSGEVEISTTVLARNKGRKMLSASVEVLNKDASSEQINGVQSTTV